MASHVILIDSRARQTRIATSAATHLSDVLSQGCQKLGLDAALFVLQHNGKAVDLSRSIRQTGLPSGAQLQLVQGSRSPSVITVAVQIPYLETTRRVTEKVPSSHSIWQILRLLETKEKLNFTQRGVGSFDLSNTGGGSGRMFYEMPVVNILNRDLSSFTDLQKSLSQLGITSGNVLMRLTFKVTKQPLEEAMADISPYFKATSSTAMESTVTSVTTGDATPLQSGIEPSITPSTNEASTPSGTTAPVTSPTIKDAPQSTRIHNASTADQTSSQPMITIYTAPTTTATSHVIHNEADYIPTAEHATFHQARLKESSRNRRLLSDAEIAAKQQEQDARLEAVDSVEVRIRFPDQTQIKSVFSRGSSASSVYAAVRSQMDKPDLKFAIRYVDARGAHVVLPDDAKFDIIRDAKWRGRVLANMEWDASVSPDIRGQPVLTTHALQQAQALPVPRSEEDSKQPQGGEKKGGLLGSLLKKDGGKSELSGAEKEDKLKKLLRFGKK